MQSSKRLRFYNAFKLDAINYLRQDHTAKETIAYRQDKHPHTKPPNQGMLSTWRKMIESAEKNHGETRQRQWIHLAGNRCNNRPSDWPVLDNALYQWHRKVITNPANSVTNAKLLAYASRLWEAIRPLHYPQQINRSVGAAALNLTWFWRYKQRHGLQTRRRGGEVVKQLQPSDKEEEEEETEDEREEDLQDPPLPTLAKAREADDHADGFEAVDPTCSTFGLGGTRPSVSTRRRSKACHQG